VMRCAPPLATCSRSSMAYAKHAFVELEPLLTETGVCEADKQYLHCKQNHNISTANKTTAC
jgi:hypothetical protein